MTRAAEAPVLERALAVARRQQAIYNDKKCKAFNNDMMERFDRFAAMEDAAQYIADEIERTCLNREPSDD